MGQVVRMPKKAISLQAAVDAFVSQPDLAPTTERTYRQTLTLVVAALDPALPIGELDPVQIQGVLEQRWSKAAPATWNRQVATLRSFLSYCCRCSWLPEATFEAKRRREHEDRTRSIPAVELERLWRRQDLALRDKALWRLLYETAARADANASRRPAHSRQRVTGQAVGAPQRAQSGAEILGRPARHAGQSWGPAARPVEYWTALRRSDLGREAPPPSYCARPRSPA